MISSSLEVRQAIKRIPGAKWAYRSFIQTPGSWIFHTETSAWLKDPENYGDLPLLYKLFATYFIHAPRSVRGKVVGAELSHRLISWLTQVLRLRRYSKAVVGDLKVYLNLSDPRSLVVPGEIKSDPDLAVLSDFLGRGDTFVDVGANHGSFSIVASQCVGPDGLIVAVEPQPILAALVERSLAENKTTAFEVHRFACSDEEGTQTFFVPKATSGSAGIFREHSAVSAFDALNVPLKCFDTAVHWRAFRGRVLVKLDVEGSEIRFLKGAREFLSSCQPNILLEVSPGSIAASGQSESNLVGTLSELGYSHFREICDPEPVPLKAMQSSPQRNVIVLSPKGPLALDHEPDGLLARS
jgi:FkbM family methyltransferase